MYLSWGSARVWEELTLSLDILFETARVGLRHGFRWFYASPTDVDELHPFFFWVYLSHHSANDSKVGFLWCYNQLVSIFIMKIIVTVASATETHSVIYRSEKTRRVISTNLAPNVKQKYV